MIKSMVNRYELTEDDREHHELAEWIWQSHLWEEWSPGYWVCIWCDKKHTSLQPISSTDSLCQKNPAVMRAKDYPRGIGATFMG